MHELEGGWNEEVPNEAPQAGALERVLCLGAQHAAAGRRRPQCGHVMLQGTMAFSTPTAPPPALLRPAAVKCDENGDALEGAEPLRLWTVSAGEGIGQSERRMSSSCCGPGRSNWQLQTACSWTLPATLSTLGAVAGSSPQMALLPDPFARELIRPPGSQ